MLLKKKHRQANVIKLSCNKKGKEQKGRKREPKKDLAKQKPAKNVENTNYGNVFSNAGAKI